MQARERIAANVRRIRVAKGVSQEGLASDAGVSVTYLSGIETAQANASADLLDRIAVALEVDVAELFARAGTDVTVGLKPGRKPKA